MICTDVGGTSFDVGLILRGEVPLRPEPVVSQYVLRMPKIPVQLDRLRRRLASAWLDEGGLLRVGPQSAGSRPGPACYGQGGTEATVTDADLVLGYLDPARSSAGAWSSTATSRSRRSRARRASSGWSPRRSRSGVFRIINAQMADLIRKSTIEQGHDPRECVLVAYGGAGPTHAAFYGHDIGSKAILVLADSTVFSAEGMLTCDVTHTAQASAPAHDAVRRRGPRRDDRALRRRSRSGSCDQFAREGAPGEDVALARTLGVRYRQQVHTARRATSIPGALTHGAGARLLRRASPSATAHLYGRGRAAAAAAALSSSCTASSARAPIEPRPASAPREPGGADASAALKGEREAHFEPRASRSTRGLRRRRAARRQPWSPARRSCSGWATASSSPPTTRRLVDRYLTLRLAAPTAASASPDRRTKPDVGDEHHDDAWIPVTFEVIRHRLWAINDEQAR